MLKPGRWVICSEPWGWTTVPDVKFGAAIFLNAGPNVFEDVQDVRFTFGPTSNGSAIHEKESAYSVCLRM
jgi:hypothetical protein